MDALSGTHGAIAEMPCIAMFACGPSVGGDDAAMPHLVDAASELIGTSFKGAPRERGDVRLPAVEWGVGRSVAVDRRYSPCGSMLVVVPAARRHAGGGATTAASSVADDATDTENDCCDTLLANTAIPPPAAGVLEVLKEAAAATSIDKGVAGSGRRAIVLHLACRLPRVAQRAVARIIETSHARALFVITCSRQSALDARLASLALLIPVAASRTAGNSSGECLRNGLANGTSWGTHAIRRAALLAKGKDDVVSKLAAAEAAIARIRALGGDPPSKELVQRVVSIGHRKTKNASAAKSAARDD